MTANIFEINVTLKRKKSNAQINNQGKPKELHIHIKVEYYSKKQVSSEEVFPSLL